MANGSGKIILGQYMNFIKDNTSLFFDFFTDIATC